VQLGSGTGILAEADRGDSGAARTSIGGQTFLLLEAYRRSLRDHRENLRKMLGLLDLSNKSAEVKSVVLESDGVGVEM